MHACSLCVSMLLVLGAQWLVAPVAAQPRECRQRFGPYATQDGAWRNQRQAQAQGYGTSNVFPCADANGYRGYCFNVFSPC
jgi:hypothetical protein